MFETQDEISRQLRAGEDSFAEFKEVTIGGGGGGEVKSPNPESMAGEFVAFANSDGGVVFLGVDDQGIVRPIPDESAGSVEQWVMNIASNNCDPPVRPVIRRVRLPTTAGPEGLIMVVEIKRSLYVHRTHGGRYYGRFGSTKRDLTSAELARLFQQRGRAFVFDEQAVPSASEADLDRAAMVACFGPMGELPWPDLLRNLRVLVTDDGGVDRPTVAGLLAFAAAPREHLASAFIDAAVYRGGDLSSDDLVHAQAIEGPVAAQIEAATAFVERFMLRPARRPDGRDDHPQYTVGAVHEAIVNAVAHRDYSISGAKIRLFLFADRLELYSPGSLPNTLTLETMPFRVFTRNQLLVTFLSKLKHKRTGRAFLESRGEGVRRILKESEQQSGRRPEYRLLGQELLLTIWAQPSPHGQEAP